MRTLIFALCALALSACAIKEHKERRDAAMDDSRCQGYGLAPGTEAYASCRVQMDAARRSASGAFMGGVIQNQK